LLDYLLFYVPLEKRMCKKKGCLHAKAKKNKARWLEFVYFQKATQLDLNREHWQ
jgi:hypothetical protein